MVLAMMNVTLKTILGMEVTAVDLMSMTGGVGIVNVWTPIQNILVLKEVKMKKILVRLGMLVMDTVTMNATLKTMILMEVIAVEMMSKLGIAPNVLASNEFKLASDSKLLLRFNKTDLFYLSCKRCGPLFP